MRRLRVKKVYLLAKDIADDLISLAHRVYHHYLPAAEVAGQVVEIANEYRIRLEKLKMRHKADGDVRETLASVDAFIRKTASVANTFLAQDSPPDEMAFILESSANGFINQVMPGPRW
ncbi:hypothetical protein V3F56_03120 [Moorellaceae bacterium AZ2]